MVRQMKLDREQQLFTYTYQLYRGTYVFLLLMPKDDPVVLVLVMQWVWLVGWKLLRLLDVPPKVTRLC